MTSKLATFRTDDKIWQSFQDKAKANGTNASALLQRFVQNYLDGNIDGIDNQSRQADNGIDIALDERIDEIKTELDSRIDERIDSKISNLQTVVTNQNREIDALKLELENIKIAIATLTREAKAPAKKPLKAA